MKLSIDATKGVSAISFLFDWMRMEVIEQVLGRILSYRSCPTGGFPSNAKHIARAQIRPGVHVEQIEGSTSTVR